MDNLNIYNQARSVPREALKEIQAGRLKGKSDINPMWRIKKLTELFGPCGIGWKYTITKQWLERGANDEISAFVNIDLFIKVDGVWSDAIPGTGGSSFVTKEKSGLYTSDECFKMALTDAISVACKALGFAADVYWKDDSTKYQSKQEQSKVDTPQAITQSSIKALHALRNELGKGEEEFKAGLGVMLKRQITSLKDLTESEAKALIKALRQTLEQRKAG